MQFFLMKIARLFSSCEWMDILIHEHLSWRHCYVMIMAMIAHRHLLPLILPFLASNVSCLTGTNKQKGHGVGTPVHKLRKSYAFAYMSKEDLLLFSHLAKTRARLLSSFLSFVRIQVLVVYTHAKRDSFFCWSWLRTKELLSDISAQTFEGDHTKFTVASHYQLRICRDRSTRTNL